MKKFYFKLITFEIILILLTCININAEPLNKNNPTYVNSLKLNEGQCILIKDHDNTVLIDLGGAHDKDNIKSYLKDKKIEKIDTLILTMYNENTFESIKSLLNYTKINEVLLPKYNEDVPGKENIMVLLQKNNIPCSLIDKGFSYNKGNIFLESKISINASSDYSINQLLFFGTIDEIKYLFGNDSLFKDKKSIKKLGELRGIDVLTLYNSSNTYKISKSIINHIDPLICLVNDGSNSNNYLETLLLNNKCKVYKTSSMNNIKVERKLNSNDIIINKH